MTTALLLDRRLPLAEISAARLDGDVRTVGPAYTPADVPDGPELRAAALAALVPRDAVVEGRAAAWIHGAWCAPVTLTIARPVSTRPPRGPTAVLVRQAAHPGRDVVRVGPIAVTTPVRTALDLARREPTADLRVLTAIATLLVAGGIDPATAQEALAGRGTLPHRLRIRRRLVELERLVSLP